MLFECSLSPCFHFFKQGFKELIWNSEEDSSWLKAPCTQLNSTMLHQLCACLAAPTWEADMNMSLVGDMARVFSGAVWPRK